MTTRPLKDSEESDHSIASFLQTYKEYRVNISFDSEEEEGQMKSPESIRGLVGERQEQRRLLAITCKGSDFGELNKLSRILLKKVAHCPSKCIVIIGPSIWPS